ncbi:MAG: hypothetical protein R6V85_08430 [Polyangia bacterium]
MKKAILTIVAIASLAALAACTVITDFDEPKDAGPDAGDLYSIDQNLATSIEVTLISENGELTMSFAEQLPQADDDTLLGLVTDGTVDLVVENLDTGVSFDLAEDGSYSDSISGPGDYNLELGLNRDTITVVFYNEVAGTSLHAGGDYESTITVNSNDYFVAETFTRSVTVTEP